MREVARAQGDGNQSSRVQGPHNLCRYASSGFRSPVSRVPHPCSFHQGKTKFRASCVVPATCRGASTEGPSMAHTGPHCALGSFLLEPRQPDQFRVSRGVDPRRRPPRAGRRSVTPTPPLPTQPTRPGACEEYSLRGHVEADVPVLPERVQHGHGRGQPAGCSAGPTAASPRLLGNRPCTAAAEPQASPRHTRSPCSAARGVGSLRPSGSPAGVGKQ